MWSPSLVGALLPLSWIAALLRLHLPQGCTSLLLAFSLWDFPPFGFTLQPCFSCSLKEPEQRSCRLYAVRCVTSNQVPVTLCLSRSPPFRFYHSKSYFRHFNNGLLALNSSAHTIPNDSHTNGFVDLDLVAQYHTVKMQHHKAVWQICLNIFADRPIFCDQWLLWDLWICP